MNDEIDINQLLETKFSIENVENYKSTQAFVYALIANGVFKSQKDINLFLLEGIQKAAAEDDEFPIRIYKKDEEMSEASKIVKNIGEMLTDDFIKKL